MELSQITDFRDEVAELHPLLAKLTDADWQRPTLFKQWTINDVIQHLHDGDLLGLASATDEGAFTARVADRQGYRDKGMSRLEETRRRFATLTGARLLDQWRKDAARLADALAAKEPADRLIWFGPSMGVRMFATARQMETWAHSQAIYDLLGIERPAASPRLRNIAEIGVRTFAWAYRNRGLDVPAAVPFIRLATPFGETWEWNEPSDVNAVTGNALDFCQVVTQTRNAADTDLSVAGETARHWMTIVQCFAGPPETPPAPGSRRRAGV